MFGDVRATVASHTAHPILGSLLLGGLGLFLVALVVRLVAGDGLLAGFVTVYAIMAGALGLGGFAIAKLTGLVHRLRPLVGTS